MYDYSPTLQGAKKKAQGIANRLGIELDILKFDRQPSHRGGYSPAERVGKVTPATRNRRRNRKMTTPTAPRRTIRAIERRTSSALRHFLERKNRRHRR